MKRLIVVLPALVSVVFLAACSEKPVTSSSTAQAPAAVAAPPPTVQSSFDLPSHSDENWVNGVAKNWGAAFFVINGPAVPEAMATGNEVTFSDGTKRIIQGTKVNGDTLIVNLEGTPLDGKVVGHPNKVRVGKPAK